MARATLVATASGTSIADLNVTGADLTVGTADGIDFANTGNERVVLYNDDVASHYADAIAQGDSNGIDFADERITVAAGKTRVWGPFDLGAVNIAGKVQIDYEVGEHEHFFATVIRMNNIT